MVIAAGLFLAGSADRDALARAAAEASEVLAVLCAPGRRDRRGGAQRGGHGLAAVVDGDVSGRGGVLGVVGVQHGKAVERLRVPGVRAQQGVPGLEEDEVAAGRRGARVGDGE